MQASPALRIFATIAPSSAASRSASSKTMNGALPPSSIELEMTCFGRFGEEEAAHSGRACEREFPHPWIRKHSGGGRSRIGNRKRR